MFSNKIKHYPDQSICNRIEQVLQDAGLFGKNKQVIEIGCGNSSWLAVFAKKFGFHVCGLDYAEHGCQQTRDILCQEGIEGKIIQQDLFDDLSIDLSEKFDVVYSLGLVEHFTDTSEAVRALSRFLKPGGIIITMIPNFTSLLGWIQKNV